MSGWLNGREGGRPIVYLDVPGARLRVWFYADKAGCELPWRAGARRDSGTFVVIGSFAGRDEAMVATEAWYAGREGWSPVVAYTQPGWFIYASFVPDWLEFLVFEDSWDTGLSAAWARSLHPGRSNIFLGAHPTREAAMIACEEWRARGGWREESTEPPRPICHPPAPADPL